jgi:hypothetical protein
MKPPSCVPPKNCFRSIRDPCRISGKQNSLLCVGTYTANGRPSELDVTAFDARHGEELDRIATPLQALDISYKAGYRNAKVL